MGDITQLMRTWLWIKMRSQVATDDDECVSERSRAKKPLDWLKMKMKWKTKPVFKADSHTLLVVAVAPSHGRIWILFHRTLH